ncbi:MAG: S-layer homology domain-containing protein [Firmicutes bacterium]|nr:S-layer homology domain-containing protein [Bacillota bacterium]
MQWANEMGILNGSTGGLLNPQGSATRAEVAQMLMTFCEKFGK